MALILRLLGHRCPGQDVTDRLVQHVRDVHLFRSKYDDGVSGLLRANCSCGKWYRDFGATELAKARQAHRQHVEQVIEKVTNGQETP